MRIFLAEDKGRLVHLIVWKGYGMEYGFWICNGIGFCYIKHMLQCDCVCNNATPNTYVI